MPQTDHRPRDQDVFDLNWPKPLTRCSVPARWPGAMTVALSVCFPTAVHAHADEAERRQHDAHVHDVAHLSLISDGAQLRLELEGAAAGFLGFEHAPRNEDESRAVAALKDRLRMIDSLFQIDAKARCSLDAIAIDMAGLEHHAEHQDHDHDHHHADHDGGHADIKAQYDFTCRSIEALETVAVTLFDHFPGFETVEAVYLLDDRQSAQALRQDRPVLRLR